MRTASTKSEARKRKRTVKPRVLIVEDDEFMAMIVGAKLEREGFTVKTCADGGAAFATACAFRPHLILLDLLLPNVMGFDNLALIRNNESTRHMKVLIFSHLAGPEDRKLCLQNGADGFICKSHVSLSDVVAAIHETLWPKGGSKKKRRAPTR